MHLGIARGRVACRADEVLTDGLGLVGGRQPGARAVRLDPVGAELVGVAVEARSVGLGPRQLAVLLDEKVADLVHDGVRHRVEVLHGAVHVVAAQVHRGAAERAGHRLLVVVVVVHRRPQEEHVVEGRVEAGRRLAHLRVGVRALGDRVERQQRLGAAEELRRVADQRVRRGRPCAAAARCAAGCASPSRSPRPWPACSSRAWARAARGCGRPLGCPPGAAT